MSWRNKHIPIDWDDSFIDDPEFVAELDRRIEEEKNTPSPPFDTKPCRGKYHVGYEWYGGAVFTARTSRSQAKKLVRAALAQGCVWAVYRRKSRLVYEYGLWPKKKRLKPKIC